jgi:hypothetical protein
MPDLSSRFGLIGRLHAEVVIGADDAIIEPSARKEQQGPEQEQEPGERSSPGVLHGLEQNEVGMLGVELDVTASSPNPRIKGSRGLAILVQ